MSTNHNRIQVLKRHLTGSSTVTTLNGKNNMSTSERKTITLHVLDTTKGCAVEGLKVNLFKLGQGGWKAISENVTDASGRCPNMIDVDSFSPGCYRLLFSVRQYYEKQQVACFYPFIEIAFDVKSPKEHFHVPLLLSPFGYTTYRGS